MKTNMLQTPSFLYGYGLFETMLAKNGRVLFLAEHLKRLLNSAKKINLIISQPERIFINALMKAAGKIKSGDVYLRLNVWSTGKGSDFDIIARKYIPPAAKEYSQGWKVTFAQEPINESSKLAGIKSLNYLANYLASIAAQNRGFNEALLLNSQGYIAEGTRSNIFLVKNRALFTPSLNCGVLNGIIRQQIIKIAQKQKIPCKEACLKIKDLRGAQEIFLTNSLIGVMPVKQLGSLKLKREFPLTQRISNFYRELIG